MEWVRPKVEFYRLGNDYILPKHFNNISNEIYEY